MTRQPVVTCAQCGTLIEGEPIALGQDMFCCLGCVGGGPCICARTNGDALLLRAGPFASQVDLLRFAARLEQAPGLLHVEMTHAELHEARFAIVAPSADMLVRTLDANPNHTISVDSDRGTVSARIGPPRGSVAPPPPDKLLPPRTRFRVFRMPTEPPVSDVAPPLPPVRERAPESSQPRQHPARALEAAIAEDRAARRQAQIDAQSTSPSTPRSTASRVGSEMLVVASPFHSFVALNEFQGLLRALPGVRDTRVRRFYGGTLTLAIDYEDNVPLPDRLHDASGGAWAVVSSAAGRIEIATIGTSSFARHRDA